MSFDKMYLLILQLLNGLNPFRAGQCLSTQVQFVHKDMHKVSIPFEQGNVFRLIASEIESKGSVSQSLSSRAMSFDRVD